VAKKMFIENDQNASMQAFMNGTIKVEGDMTKLMMMQAAGPPSAEALKVQAAVTAMTE
jgi:putative sterol carrier protein